MTQSETLTEHRSVEAATTALVAAAYAVVEKKYGPNSPEPKGYHNLDHTRRDVVGGLAEMADMALAAGRITERGKALLLVAGAFHDIEQGLGSGANERESAEAAKAAMRSANVFTREDEATVEGVIMATQVTFTADGITQAVPEGNLLAEFMADADLSALGRPTDVYWARAVGLFAELYGHEAGPAEQEAFLRNQVALLTSHRYYTPEAEELFPHREANLAYTQAVLDALAG